MTVLSANIDPYAVTQHCGFIVMESDQENESISLEDSVSSSGLEPLINIAVGASEEVNNSGNRSENELQVLQSLKEKNSSQSNNISSESDNLAHSSPLNSPIVSCSMTPNSSQTPTSTEPLSLSDLVRAVSTTDLDVSSSSFPVENLHLVQMQETNTNMTNEVVGENTSGFVVIEQSVFEQISGFLRNAVALQANSTSKLETEGTNTKNDSALSEQSAELPNSTTNYNAETTAKINSTKTQVNPSDDDEWIDTKATALQLTDELRRYHIPQAVFARKILNRSQGTLSDILSKPKPWNEMKLGKEIFRKMKEWLSLPEVKRIPQLRTEAAKELDSRQKRNHPETYDENKDTPKKMRRQFTESQKRALFAIFKETKKPTKDMQRALADELGLDITSVSNFFMNARRRHPQD